MQSKEKTKTIKFFTLFLERKILFYFKFKNLCKYIFRVTSEKCSFIAKTLDQDLDPDPHNTYADPKHKLQI